MRKHDNLLWVEKYAPRSVSECIMPDRYKEKFQGYVDSGRIPNLLLTGSPGIGKTTVALAMVRELNADYLLLNGSDKGRLIDTVRNEITQFASTKSLGGAQKYVIMDEADYMNAESVQPAMRHLMDRFQKNCGFILTCNFENRIIDPLHSRITTVRFDFTHTETKQMGARFIKRLQDILDAEGIEYDLKVLAYVVKTHMPDWRKILNQLQGYASRNQKIDTGVMTRGLGENVSALINMLKAKKFTEIRKWTAENKDTDFVQIVRTLYDGMYDNGIKKSSLPQLVLILNDYLYKHNFVADPEINTMAMFTEIMKYVEFE